MDAGHGWPLWAGLHGPTQRAAFAAWGSVSRSPSRLPGAGFQAKHPDKLTGVIICPRFISPGAKSLFLHHGSSTSCPFTRTRPTSRTGSSYNASKLTNRPVFTESTTSKTFQLCRMTLRARRSLRQGEASRALYVSRRLRPGDARQMRAGPPSLHKPARFQN